MRAVWIATVLFCAMLLLLGYNSVSLLSDTNEMKALAEQMSAVGERREALSALESLWKEREAVFELSVPYADVNRISELIDQLRRADAADLDAEFDVYRIHLLSVLDGIARVERVTLGSIF